MFTADVCSCKVTLLNVCVCASVGRKVSILIVVLRGPVIINAFVVAQFKICLQFEFVCWQSLPVSALTGVLVAVLGRRRGVAVS